MRRLGIYSTSGDKHTRLRNQMKRLFYSQIVLVYKDAPPCGGCPTSPARADDAP